MITDPRFIRLAEGLAGFSTDLMKGERALIDAFDVPDAIVIALIRALRRDGLFVPRPLQRLNPDYLLGEYDGRR